MLCKSIRSTKIWSMLIAIGIVTLLFGIVYSQKISSELHHMQMLMGMLTIPDFIALGALCIQAFAFFIAYKRFNSKM